MAVFIKGFLKVIVEPMIILYNMQTVIKERDKINT